MAYNEKLTERVRGALKGVMHLEERKMFRGVTFMVGGKMCVSAGDDELMFRLDPKQHELYLSKNGTRPMKMKGREYKGYICVKEDAIKSDRALKAWLDAALRHNKTLVS